jgi:hypothetical protein
MDSPARALGAGVSAAQSAGRACRARWFLVHKAAKLFYKKVTARERGARESLKRRSKQMSAAREKDAGEVSARYVF